MPEEKSLARPAAQYLRVSTLGQNRSLAGQAMTIGSFALAEGFEIVASYEDAGKSGVTARGREGLASLMSDVLSGHATFSTILVLDVSRWGRYQDPDEAAHYEFLCRSAGIQVRYCAEVFEEGPTASIMKQLKRVMAAEYSRELSLKVKRSQRRTEGLGLTQGGCAPFGIQRREVRRDGSKGSILVRGQLKSRPDYGVEMIPGPPDEQRIARKIFSLYVKGRMLPAKIAVYLNERQHQWRVGKPWNADRVEAVISCDLLAGRQLRGRVETRLGENHIYHPRERWRLTHRINPVVSPALFKAARMRRSNLKRCAMTRNELLGDLRRLLGERGYLSRDMIEADKRMVCSGVMTREFGSLTAAYGLIGYTQKIRKGHLPDRQDVIANLQRLDRKFGRVTTKIIRADPDIQTEYAMRLLFGSTRAACEEAGVRYARRVIGVKSA